MKQGIVIIGCYILMGLLALYLWIEDRKKKKILSRFNQVSYSVFENREGLEEFLEGIKKFPLEHKLQTARSLIGSPLKAVIEINNKGAFILHIGVSHDSFEEKNNELAH